MCRDAASCELELSTLEEVQKGFEQACFSAGGQEIYGPLVDAVARTATWLRARAEAADIRQQNDSGKRFEGVCGAMEVVHHPSCRLVCTAPRVKSHIAITSDAQQADSLLGVCAVARLN